MRIDEADLLGLVVGDRSALGQWIYIVVSERTPSAFFVAATLGRARTLLLLLHVLLLLQILLVLPIVRGAHDVDLARDQLRHGVAEGRTGLVGERDPALHVELVRLLIEQRDVIRFP